ncbi:hypothetical protein ACQCRT_05315, partial [Ralstonia pseudosolanacearum]
MKLSALMFSMAALLAGSAYAQTPAAATAPATASGGVHAVCKDGTPYSGATLRGACRGHGGVDKKASAADAAPAANAPATSAAMPAAAALHQQDTETQPCGLRFVRSDPETA